MEPIFYTRSKGRVRKMLSVYCCDEQYRLHFIVLDRTNPSKEERANGVKEKRFETLNQEFFSDINRKLIPEDYPLPELVKEFIQFINEKKNDYSKTDA